MKFAVDVDDTITSWPDEFKAIMESLMSCGHEVYILTGGMDSVSSSEKFRERQLLEMGVSRDVHYDDIQVCISNTAEGVAKLKGKFCKVKGINVAFDDLPGNHNEIRYQSPDTLSLLVMK